MSKTSVFQVMLWHTIFPFKINLISPLMNPFCKTSSRHSIEIFPIVLFLCVTDSHVFSENRVKNACTKNTP